MARFLIEVPHAESPLECWQAIQVWMSTGSHFLSQADWGCNDGVHKAWVTVEVDNREEARGILPPIYRSRASIIELSKFTLEEADEAVESHRPSK